MFYVYVLKSLKDKNLYIGYTTDLKKRIFSHKSGFNIATKDRRPLNLIYYEAFLNKTDARKREIFFKSGYGHQQLDSILKNTLV
jgi:putative endonuclease